MNIFSLKILLINVLLEWAEPHCKYVISVIGTDLMPIPTANEVQDHSSLQLPITLAPEDPTSSVSLRATGHAHGK